MESLGDAITIRLSRRNRLERGWHWVACRRGTDLHGTHTRPAQVRLSTTVRLKYHQLVTKHEWDIQDRATLKQVQSELVSGIQAKILRSESAWCKNDSMWSGQGSLKPYGPRRKSCLCVR